MIDNEIEEILKQKLGVRITAIGQTNLDRAVARRMKAVNIADQEQYILKLRFSKKETEELIEEIVIPETWFFRDEEPFKLLTHYITEIWPDNNKSTHMVRILSVPCSSGEEPYSIIISLLEAGWTAGKMRVDAVDISYKAIAKAQHGIYSQNSFRGKNMLYQAKYFDRNNNKFHLHDKIKKMVHFIHGNILNSEFLQRLGTYDVIFCRNVLIYLDNRAQSRTIDSIFNMLAPGGLLITGHAEAGLISESGKFRPSSHVRGFAFFKDEDSGECDHQDWCRADTYSPTFTIHSHKSHPKPVAGTFHTSSASRKQKSSAKFSSLTRYKADKTHDNNGETILDRAVSLADKGKLQEASVLCRDFLSNNGPSAKAYFLLGVINDFEGNTTEAVKLLRKVLYLEPDHIEALVLLSYLSEKNGDVKSAENYKRRISLLSGDNLRR